MLLFSSIRGVSRETNQERSGSRSRKEEVGVAAKSASDRLTQALCCAFENFRGF